MNQIQFVGKPGSLETSRFLFSVQIFFVLIGLFLTFLIQRDFQKSQNEKQLHMAISPELVPHLVLGFTNIAADFYWIRTIQEIDFKEEGKINKGWVFQMLDSVTNLDHRFKMAYMVGTLVISVLVHDDEGARLLYEKAVQYYPDDWVISYHAGYHYLYAIKDCKRAAELFKSAADHGAPAWVNALSARLYNISGQYEIARSILVNALKATEGEPKFHKRIQQRLDELEESRRSGRTSDFAKCEDFNNNLPAEKDKLKSKKQGS